MSRSELLRPQEHSSTAGVGSGIGQIVRPPKKEIVLYNQKGDVMYRSTLLGICTLLAFVAAEPAAGQQRVDGMTFARMVTASDAFEAQSSHLALQRSTNPPVRAFAQQMVNDHSATSAALQQSAPMLAAFLEPLGHARSAPRRNALTAFGLERAEV